MANKKNNFLCLRVTDEEREHIKKLTYDLYMPVSNFIFMCINEYEKNAKGKDE